MLRKTISLLVLALFVCSNMGLVFAGTNSEMTLLDKIAVVEKLTVGTEQTGAVVDRISRLEKDLWGRETTGSLVSRVEKIYSYYYVNGENAPSFLTKMNATEWTLTHVVTVLPVKMRIENMERLLLNNIVTGSFDDRLNSLLKYAYTNGKVVVSNVVVNKDTLVKIKLVTPLSAHTSRTGDVVTFQVADDIYVDGNLIVAKGAQGTGVVNKVVESRNFGRDAELQIGFDTIDAIDGSSVHMILGDKAKEENKSLATAAGASVAGMAILGPVGIIGGAFVHGKNVEIAAGTEVYIQVKEQMNVYAISMK